MGVLTASTATGFSWGIAAVAMRSGSPTWGRRCGSPTASMDPRCRRMSCVRLRDRRRGRARHPCQPDRHPPPSRRSAATRPMPPFAAMAVRPEDLARCRLSISRGRDRGSPERWPGRNRVPRVAYTGGLFGVGDSCGDRSKTSLLGSAPNARLQPAAGRRDRLRREYSAARGAGSVPDQQMAARAATWPYFLVWQHQLALVWFPSDDGDRVRLLARGPARGDRGAGPGRRFAA